MNNPRILYPTPDGGVSLSQERIHELFYYENGSLYWKTPTSFRCQPGDEAGSVNGDGRRYVKVDGRAHLVHRLIFCFHHGHCPQYLDHIDRNCSINKIENLRPATRSQNNRNKSISKSNRTGFKGIYRQGNKFKATICVNKKNIYLGSYDTPEQAQQAYAEAAATHFKEFAHV